MTDTGSASGHQATSVRGHWRDEKSEYLEAFKTGIGQVLTSIVMQGISRGKKQPGWARDTGWDGSNVDKKE
ncbi:MAG TPA: hypothetical protein GX529_00570 [Firmicutes bacterium]|nr:hypothetical protein [Candidatus Fermentithermobacillaceae bacterium]